MNNSGASQWTLPVVLYMYVNLQRGYYIGKLYPKSKMETEILLFAEPDIRFRPTVTSDDLCIVLEVLRVLWDPEAGHLDLGITETAMGDASVPQPEIQYYM